MKKTEINNTLTVVEAAEFLGVSKETIYRWVKAKKIPVYRLGKFWRFDKDELLKWFRKAST